MTHTIGRDEDGAAEVLCDGVPTGQQIRAGEPRIACAGGCGEYIVLARPAPRIDRVLYPGHPDYPAEG